MHLRRVLLVAAVGVVCAGAFGVAAGGVDSPVVSDGVSYDVELPADAFVVEETSGESGDETDPDSAAGVWTTLQGGETDLGLWLMVTVFAGWLLVAFRKMNAAAVTIMALAGGAVLAAAALVTVGDLPTTTVEGGGDGSLSLLDRLAFLLVAAAFLASGAALFAPDDADAEAASLAVRSKLGTLAGLLGQAGRWAGRRAGGGYAGSNPVYEAWAGLASESGVEDPTDRTPGELANEAADAGLSAEAVEDLRTTFEEVRYGDAEITEDRARAASRALDRARGDGE